MTFPRPDMGFYSHIAAGFSLGFCMRHELGHLLHATPQDRSIANLDPNQLHSQGIRVLALDFDGVLSPHGFAAPIPTAEQWLKSCSTVFGEDCIFILSNKPTLERKEWFESHFPAIRFISGVRKKPFPDGLKKIEELSQAPLPSILMVDDRLLTGCLAALAAGATPCYIRRPFVSFRHNSVPEAFFTLMRVVERLFVTICKLF
jgi:predicted HAD superfamily phosphohydrolase YqeG